MSITLAALVVPLYSQVEVEIYYLIVPQMREVSSVQHIISQLQYIQWLLGVSCACDCLVLCLYKASSGTDAAYCES